ncbi:MAG: DUF881 domain-containing protein [Firmicutes bacterium]|nr:DUF881 domain-containing protein [Bacillota bacterium]
MKKEKIAILSGIICLVLAFAISLQFKTITHMAKDIGGTTLGSNTDLQNQYLQWKSMTDAADKNLAAAESNLEKVRSEAAANNANDVAVEAQIQKNNSILGFSDVSGDGVTVILNDNKNASAANADNISDYVIHQQDIQNVVNELFNAGAEAVSINGERVVLPTAIFCDGNIIRINNVKVSVPVVIQAIGSQSGLMRCFNKNRTDISA